jgi:hypothetical protein
MKLFCTVAAVLCLGCQSAAIRIPYEYCSYLTPHGKYLFFSSDYDVKWMDAKQLGIR